MDAYTKSILTLIAVSLSAIALRLFEPQQAQASILSQGPTLGDALDLRDIKDPKERKDAQTRLMRSIPLVRVQGGNVDVSQ